MSKEINLEEPLSEFDLRYLVDRGRWDDIRTNAQNLGLPEPTLPSSRGLRAQVPRSRLRNTTDGFDDIAAQLRVSRDEDDPQSPTPDRAALRRAEATAGATRTETSEETDPAGRYRKMTVMQLKDELDNRREAYIDGGDEDAAREVSYGSEDKKDDLIKKLMDDDAAVDDEDDESDD